MTRMNSFSICEMEDASDDLQYALFLLLDIEDASDNHQNKLIVDVGCKITSLFMYFYK